MIVEMRTGATKKEVNDVVQKAKSLGLDVQLNLGTNKTVVAILGNNTGQIPTDMFAVIPGVERIDQSGNQAEGEDLPLVGMARELEIKGAEWPFFHQGLVLEKDCETAAARLG